MIEAIRNIFGTYSPIVNPDGTIPSGLAGVNMEYVAVVALFAICLICVFKIIGVVVRHL
ncbi:MAG: hypothetical protein VB064_15215 [Oscillospiraceae bacterium]|nr:hypothetical protein [Oscillospiraceae bacterium]